MYIVQRVINEASNLPQGLMELQNHQPHQPPVQTHADSYFENCWLVVFGFNGPLRQYFSLYRTRLTESEGEKGEK